MKLGLSGHRNGISLGPTPLYEDLVKYGKELEQREKKSSSNTTGGGGEGSEGDVVSGSPPLESSQPAPNTTPLDETSALRAVFLAFSSLTSGVQVKNRRWRLQIYPRSFRGDKAVEWLCNRFGITKKEALVIGIRLQNANYLQHVTNDHLFKDQPIFFHFMNERIDCPPEVQRVAEEGVKLLIGHLETATTTIRSAEEAAQLNALSSRKERTMTTSYEDLGSTLLKGGGSGGGLGGGGGGGGERGGERGGGSFSFPPLNHSSSLGNLLLDDDEECGSAPTETERAFRLLEISKRAFMRKKSTTTLRSNTCGGGSNQLPSSPSSSSFLSSPFSTSSSSLSSSASPPNSTLLLYGSSPSSSSSSSASSTRQARRVASLVSSNPTEGPSDQRIRFNADTESLTPTVRAGTEEGLIEYLTGIESDTMFREAFLMTYRLFMSSSQLLTLLLERWQNILLETEAIIQVRAFVEAKLPVDDRPSVVIAKKTKLKMLSVLKGWIEKYGSDFNDPAVRVQMGNLIDEIGKTFFTLGLKGKLDRRGQVTLGSSRENLRLMEDFNQSVLKKWEDEGEVEMLEKYSAEEFARQITICDQYNFLRIGFLEFMNTSWSKPTKAINAPNITYAIKFFNRIGHWFATEIVRRRNMKKRLSVIQKGIDIATELFKLNNFNSCMSVYSALVSTAVHRLKKTWEGLTQESKVKYTSLQQALQTSKNYKGLRRMFAYSKPPVIPYIGIYLQDLTFIEEIPARVDGNMINFFKSIKVYSTISEIRKYQQEKYVFSPIEELLNYILSAPSMTETELYQESLAVEPRNPEEALEKLMEQRDTLERTIRQLQDQLTDTTKQLKAQTRVNERIVEKNLRLTNALVCILEQNEETEQVSHDYSAILENCGLVPSEAGPGFKSFGEGTTSRSGFTPIVPLPTSNTSPISSGSSSPLTG